MIIFVVDIQKTITNHKLYQFETFVSHVKKLIQVAREYIIKVIDVDDVEQSYQYYYQMKWNYGYAQCLSIEETIQKMVNQNEL